MKEPEMVQIVRWIAQVLRNRDDAAFLEKVKSEIRALCDNFPFYRDRLEDSQ
jgi:glycine hydroxymethyltransferase